MSRFCSNTVWWSRISNIFQSWHKNPRHLATFPTVFSLSFAQKSQKESQMWCNTIAGHRQTKSACFGAKCSGQVRALLCPPLGWKLILNEYFNLWDYFFVNVSHWCNNDTKIKDKNKRSASVKTLKQLIGVWSYWCKKTDC